MHSQALIIFGHKKARSTPEKVTTIEGARDRRGRETNTNGRIKVFFVFPFKHFSEEPWKSGFARCCRDSDPSLSCEVVKIAILAEW